MFYSTHTHSNFSISDSILDPEKCAIWLKERKIDKIAITDHGNVSGSFICRQAFKKHGIKHFPGCEFYFTDDRNVKDKDTRKSQHLVGIAKTYQGVLNLFKLSSFSYTEGFYYKPRIDFELVKKYNEGIVFTSACLKGPIAKKLLENDFEGAINTARNFKEILGERFFLEIMAHDLEEQRIVNKGVIEISKKLNIKVIATTDTHYLEKDDYDFRDILIMAGQKTTINQKDRMETSCKTLYMMDEQEIRNCFKIFHPYMEEKTMMEAINNTAIVLDGEPPEMSDGQLNFPTYTLDDVTAEKEGIDKKEAEVINTLKQQDKLLWDIALKGLNKKGLADKKEYQDRLKYEYDLIKNMGFINYFLIVRDIIKHCSDIGIKVGPGRGTACSSLVGYCLGITKLDPIKYGLIFERFINPYRVGLPDIDMDFEDTKRDQVIKYIYDKYGVENVTQIATVSRLAIKSAIRDIARVLEFNTQDALNISMGAPWEDYKTVEETCQNHPEAREFVLNNKVLFKYVNKLVGMPRHFGKHPSGVVISSKKISEFAPLMYGKDDAKGDKVIMVQFDMDSIKKVGLVKMDILGLKTLGFINDILKQIKKSTGKEIDIDNIDYEDELVYKMIANGDTAYCFQIEADGITKAIKRIQPDCFHELYDLLSLYRPGGLETGQLEKYIETKFLMKEDPGYRMYPDIPEMERILRPTYYTVCYQEQIMAIVGNVGGLGMATADVFRRIIDDLKLENKEVTVAEYRGRFLEGCKKNNVTERRANEIWDFLQKYTGYSFNKSHSCGYSVLTFQTAWLKYYYKKYFLLSMFNSAEKNADVEKNSIKTCVKIAKKEKVGLLYPDVNKSGKDFLYEVDSLRWSISHIKGIGDGPVDEITSKSPFRDIKQMFESVNRKKVNKRVFVALYGAHAFDCFPIEEVRKEFQELYEENIDTLLPESELLREIKYLGLPVKKSYAEEYGSQLNGSFRLSKLAKMKTGEVNTFAGIILESALKKSKKGNVYASLIVEDDNFNRILVYLKEKDYKRLGEHVKENKFIKFQAERLDATKCRLRGYSLISLKPEKNTEDNIPF